jgi:hypothetical protein
LEFLPGETVYFGGHDASKDTCTLWVKIKEYPAAPLPESSSYEVRGFSTDASGNLNFTVINTQTGKMSPAAFDWERGYEGDSSIAQYFVKFKDNTTFYLDPAYKIAALHTGSAFASGGGRAIGYGALEFLPGATVTFGEHGQSNFSCTLWIDIGDTAPPVTPAAPYEVRNFSVNDLGYLNFDLVNNQTGEGVTPPWEQGDEGDGHIIQYFVKFPDNTVFYLDPAYKIVALHANPAFASGGGIGKGAGILEFRPGETVNFGKHEGSTVSCTLWVKVKEYDLQPAQAAHEVRNFSMDASENLSISVVKKQTGEEIPVSLEKGDEGDDYIVQYFAKLPDDTDFYLNPSYKITALHSDPHFASGGGRIKDGTIWEAYPGDTVHFGTHGEAVRSCTLWVMVAEPPLPADLPRVLDVSIVSATGAESVKKGETLLFRANVKVNGRADDTVTWAISNNSSSATSITRDGALTVGKNETAAVLNVTAKSTFDATKSSTTPVKVDSTGNPQPDNPPQPGNTEGGGGGGCDSVGVGLFSLLLLGAAFLRRAKR